MSYELLVLAIIVGLVSGVCVIALILYLLNLRDARMQQMSARTQPLHVEPAYRPQPKPPAPEPWESSERAVERYLKAYEGE